MSTTSTTIAAHAAWKGSNGPSEDVFGLPEFNVVVEFGYGRAEAFTPQQEDAVLATVHTPKAAD